MLILTNNQLSYLNLERQKSTDKANIKETKRHNLITEKLNRRANSELGRHNLVLEANQQAETAAGVKRAEISADASKYSADAHTKASKYSADRSKEASKYTADSSARASGYAADRNAQTELTKAQINKLIQAAHDKVNKAMNDDNISAANKRQIAKNASDQFIKQLDRELEKYKIKVQNKQKYTELAIKLQDSIAKNLDTSTLFKQLWNLIGK